MAQQGVLDVERIKQYPGLVQVTRRVQVKVPGKHFLSLTPNEQKEFYSGTAVEFAERHKFERHLKAWGNAGTFPGIRFICESDAIDDPDNKGYWTTLSQWNRWRHATYKDDRGAELQYLDELPAPEPGPQADVPKEKAEPEVKLHFELVAESVHTYGGKGKWAGKTDKCYYYACKSPGCKRGLAKPIKVVSTETGQLFAHLEVCQPELCVRLRTVSKYSAVTIDEVTGERYSLYSFDELLPHHARYVEKCFRGFDHYYETRAGNGLLEYIQGYDRRANLPHEQTCKQLLEVRHCPPSSVPP
jgi:hypothetical protein